MNKTKYDKPLKVIAQEHKMSLPTLAKRLQTMSLEEALAKPVNKSIAKRYKVPLKIQAETHGIGLSTLEARMRQMPLQQALNKPLQVKTRGITKSDLVKVSHLLPTHAAAKLGISLKGLNSLAKEYEVTFKRINQTKKEEIITLLWIALHSPKITYKHMSNYVSKCVNYSVSDYQIRYYVNTLLHTTIQPLKKNLDNFKYLAYQLLWTN
jgi:hypothetical protein